MQRLHIDRGQRRSVTVTWPEHIGGAAFKLRFPRCDLIGMDVELLRQLSQCSVAQGGIAERKAMIDREHDLPITKQAEILKVSRGSVYYLPRPVSLARGSTYR